MKNIAKKNNIFLIGPIGSGKSTIGRYLAEQLNIEFFDSNKEIELRTGADLSWVFDIEGENGFRYREEKIINEITKKKGIVLATGGGSIKSCKISNQLSSRGMVIYLKTNIEKQLNRIYRDKKYSFLKLKNMQRDIFNLLAKERNHLYEKIADITICTDDQTAKFVTTKISNILKTFF